MIDNYVALDIINIVTLLILMLYVNKSEALSKSSKVYFIYAELMVIIVNFAEIGCSLFDNSVPKYRIFSSFFNFIGFFVTPFIAFLFIKCCYSDNYHNKIINKIYIIVVYINSILCILSIPFGLIFKVSGKNIYERGKLYPVFVICCILGLVGVIMASINMLVKYKYSNKGALLLNGVFIIAAVIIQNLYPDLHIIWNCVTIAFVLFYCYMCEINLKYDVLTQVLNRRTYENEIEKLSCMSNYSVVLFDVDNFKTINDKNGHQYGDYCLKEIAQLISKSFGADGTCYRIGGDEFCVISKVFDKSDLKDYLRDIDKKVKLFQEEDSNRPSVSFGYSINLISEKKNFNDAFVASDKKLYKYKKVRKMH